MENARPEPVLNQVDIEVGQDLNESLEASSFENFNELASRIPRQLYKKFEKDWKSEDGLIIKKNNKNFRNINTDDLLKQYMNIIGRAPLLTKEGEVKLSQYIEKGRLSEQDSEDFWQGVWAKDKLIVSNLRLVVSVAKRYYKNDGFLSLLDLIQDGSIGLERAAEKFDWRKGFKFSTYATWWIRQSIGRSSSAQETTIYVPSQKMELIRRLSMVEMEFEKQRVQPSDEVLAEAMNLTVRELLDIIKIRKIVHLTSLDQSFTRESFDSDGGATLGEIVGENDEGFEIVEDKFSLESLGIALKILEDREKDVITKRFGLGGQEPLSLGEIGEIYGITREAVRQIEKRALKKLSSNEVLQNLRDLLI